MLVKLLKVAVSIILVIISIVFKLSIFGKVWVQTPERSGRVLLLTF